MIGEEIFETVFAFGVLSAMLAMLYVVIADMVKEVKE
jgi:hypothetical protein